MAESVDALVSNTSGATRPGSTPGLGTSLKSKDAVNQVFAASFSFQFVQKVYDITHDVLYSLSKLEGFSPQQ